MTKPTPKHDAVNKALRTILSDGAWHPFTLLFQQTDFLIDPREAARYYSHANKVRGTDSQPRTEADELLNESFEVRLASGKRRIVHMCLTTLRCEHRGERGAVEYRLPTHRVPVTLKLPRTTTPFTKAVAEVLSDGK